MSKELCERTFSDDSHLAETPEEFSVELEHEALGRRLDEFIGAPYKGIPREVCLRDILTMRENDVVELRRVGKTFKEIGEYVGLCGERTSQVLSKAGRKVDAFLKRHSGKCSKQGPQ